MIDCKHHHKGRCGLIESIVPEAKGRLLQTAWCKFCKSQVDAPTADEPGPVVAGIVVQLGKQMKRQDLIEKYQPHCEKVRSPSMLQQAGSAVTAFAKFLAAGGQRVSDEERERRQAICNGCAYFEKGRCKVCGCFLKYKIEMPMEDCPIGRWEQPTASSPLLPIIQPNEAPEQTTSKMDLYRELPSPTKNGVRSWMVGMTTAPRRQSTVERSLASTVRAGFAEGALFAEPDSTIPNELGGWQVVHRSKRLGAYGNSMLALAELYYRNPDADAYLMLQDDIEFIDADVRSYLERVLWLGDETAAVSLFTSNAYRQNSKGWFHFDRQQWRWGACAWLFPNAFVRALLAHRHIIEHACDPKTGRHLVDHTIATIIRRMRKRVYYPWPSLCQHIGETSTIWGSRQHARGNRAATVVGANAKTAAFDHVILTRFNIRRDAEIGSERYPFRGDDETWLRERVRLFEQWTLPSIRSQTLQSFRWLLLIDSASPAWLRERVASWTPAEAVFVDGSLTADRLSKLVRERASQPWLMTTRLDSDDALAYWFVERLHKEYRGEREVLNFTPGYVWATGNIRSTKQASNPFATLVEPIADCHTVLTVNHRHLASVAPIRQIGVWPAWCQVVHGGNAFNHAYLGRKTEVDPNEFFDRIRIPQPEPSCLYDRIRARFRRYRGNNYCLTREKWNAIEPLLRPDMRTLELGCGITTHLFTEIVRDHTAIEHDRRWYKLCRDGCKANLIHAPLVGTPPWYDVDVASLGKFDLILIDGPPGHIGREGALTRIDTLANEGTVIVVDDANREPEKRIASDLGRRFLVRSLKPSEFAGKS